MLKSTTKSSLHHDAACCFIHMTRAGTIADTLQSRILCSHTGLMGFAPLITHRAYKEGAGKFSPVTVDANLHLNRDRIALFDRSMRGQVEGTIGKCGTRA